jgi:hypothetical protein
MNKDHDTPKAITHKIFIYDNFDWEDGRDFAGEAASDEESLAMAKNIINRSLHHERAQAKDPQNPEEVFDRWDSFGNYPSIAPSLMPEFDVVAYAREQAKVICQQPAIGQKPGRDPWTP